MKLIDRLLGQCTGYVHRRGFELVMPDMSTEPMQNGETLSCNVRSMPIEIQDTAGTVH